MLFHFALDAFRHFLLLVAQPSIWPIALAIPFLILAPFLGQLQRFWKLMRYAWLVAFPVSGILLTAGYVYTVSMYLQSSSYFDHVESNISAVSWYAQAMKPVYHSVTSAELYNLLYGPYLYLLNGLFLKAFGATILTSKLAGVLAAFAALGLLMLVLLRISGRPSFVLGIAGFYVSLLCYFDYESFWARGDPLLLCLVTVGLLAATTNSYWSPIILGAAAGASINIKLHAFAYFVPLAFLAVRQIRFRRHFVSGIAGGLLVMAAPFLLPNVSLTNYLITLNQASNHGLDVDMYRQTVEWLFVAGFPVAMAALLWEIDNREICERYFEEQKWFLGSLLTSAAVVVVAASKFASGPHHLIPYMPILCFLFTEMHSRGLSLQWRKSLAGAFVMAFVLSWGVCCYTNAIGSMLWMRKSTKNETTSARDIEAIVRKFGSQFVILCGVGGTETDYPITFARPMLVFAGFPIGVDPSALMDSKRAGVSEHSLDEVVSETLRKQNRQKYVMWLIPRNGKAFGMKTFYPPKDSLFGASFQQQFGQRFKLLDQTQWFDLYTNKSSSP